MRLILWSVVSFTIFTTLSCGLFKKQTPQQIAPPVVAATPQQQDTLVHIEVAARTTRVGKYTITPANDMFFMIIWNDTNESQYKEKYLTSWCELPRGDTVHLLDEKTGRLVTAVVGVKGSFGNMIEGWNGNVLIPDSDSVRFGTYGIGIARRHVKVCAVGEFKDIENQDSIKALDSLVRIHWMKLRKDIYQYGESYNDSFPELPSVSLSNTIDSMYFISYHGSMLNPIVACSETSVAVIANMASSLSKVIYIDGTTYLVIETGTPGTDGCGYIFYSIAK